MENLKVPEVQAWMTAQNAYTRAVLARIPGRQKLLERLQQLGQSVLLRVSYHQGHAGIGSTEKQEEETGADIDSFLLWQFGAPGFQPKNRK